ncbi:MAG: acetyl-CoA carboxylase biotin carboxyl carrier protein [Acidobacteriota bacterium]|nr:acetyl-CoA carboxylase biotin carboxyl carrier protein [Acidobacteriota bacterium]
MLTFDQIKELIELVAQRGLQGLELERSGFRLKIDGQRSLERPPAVAEPGGAAGAPGLAAAPVSDSVVLPGAAVSRPSQGAEKAGPIAGAHILSSPIVGTFYRAPSPDAPPFVEVGSRVRKGQILCIIEAMKLMNEIECDVDGAIEEIYPQNAQAVEFGEPLFAIRAS